MRVLIFIASLTLIGLYSCKLGSTTFGETVIHVDTLLNPSVSKNEAANSDSCILRFHKDFYNDTIWIVSSNGSEKFIIASTNYSVDYASSFAVKKNLEKQIKVIISGITFSFGTLQDYLFMDIYYDKKAKRLDIYHSNNIAILS